MPDQLLRIEPRSSGSGRVCGRLPKNHSLTCKHATAHCLMPNAHCRLTKEPSVRRANWTKLAKDALSSLIRRAAFLPVSRLRRGYAAIGPFNVAAEVLEIRDLLMAPMTSADSFTVSHDHTLTVGSGSSVLNNDMNMGTGTMTAVQYSSPSHGTISAFNSNGTFTYVPNTHFAGSDSFQYEAHNN